MDNSLVTVATLSDREQLLEPVRQNLNAMCYLLHPNGEVVTEISNRQDSNTRQTMQKYWFALRYLAIKDQNGMYAAMLSPLEPEHIQLARLMAYPELQDPLPRATAIPDTYEKVYPISGITRIRRGKSSATIMHKRNSRWFSLHHGEAVIQAIRFSSAFFGKGQFSPTKFERTSGGFAFSQNLMGWYYQPITDPDALPINFKDWSRIKGDRERTEQCKLRYEGFIRETEKGFSIDMLADGTEHIPLAVEINLRAGGQLTGVAPAPHVDDAYLLKEGKAIYRMGSDVIRFGPGQCEHAYTQVRGAHPKLSGPSVYITGYTPFKYTLEIELVP